MVADWARCSVEEAKKIPIARYNRYLAWASAEKEAEAIQAQHNAGQQGPSDLMQEMLKTRGR
jgi:hypothetical protein